ncbi:chloroplastic import inner membrane translocase subunit HP30-2-like protein [Tanacetum coccineum]
MMGKGNKCNENPLTMLKSNCKKIETLCKKELAKHSALLFETAFAIVDSAVVNGVLSVVYDSFTHHAYTAFMSRLRLVTPVEPLTRGKCLMSARNFAVLSGVDAGITCVMTRVRGKNDIQSAMVAGFGAGVVASLVRGNKPAAASAIMFGVMFSLAKGGMFKVKEKSSQAQAKEDEF